MNKKENIKELLKNAQKMKIEVDEDFKLPAGWEDFDMDFVPATVSENGKFKYDMNKDKGLEVIRLKNGELKKLTIKLKVAEKNEQDLER